MEKRVVIPAKTHLRMIITYADVLHSWDVPSLGVKCLVNNIECSRPVEIHHM
jgi:heme/copper-type cytochrome/quinol oxidase subunit 2